MYIAFRNRANGTDCCDSCPRKYPSKSAKLVLIAIFRWIGSIDLYAFQLRRLHLRSWRRRYKGNIASLCGTCERRNLYIDIENSQRVSKFRAIRMHSEQVTQTSRDRSFLICWQLCTRKQDKRGRDFSEFYRKEFFF